MTSPPNPADLPGPWPDLLAAYADGELDASDRDTVERWLDAHPGAWRCVDGQRELSPANWQLWRDAEPPCPGPGKWDAVLKRIAADVIPSTRAEPATARAWRGSTRWAFAATACGITLFVVLFGTIGPGFGPTGSQRVVERAACAATDDPLAGFAVLPVVTEADVDVRRVDGAGAGGWLPVGGVPLSGPLALATADDVDVEDAEEHPAWPSGFPRVTRDPADMPVLFPAHHR